MPSRFVEPRDINVWLSDDRSGNRPLPVVYINDLEQLPDREGPWHDASGPDGHIAALAAAALSWPAIVVGIGCSSTSLRDFAPGAPLALCAAGLRGQVEIALGGPALSDAYLRFIVEELKPAIDASFPTAPGRRHTFIAGADMAGLASVYALTSYPQVFGGAASFSTERVLVPPEIARAPDHVSWSRNLERGIARYLARTLPLARSHRLYIDYSDATLDGLSGPLRSAVERIALAKGYARHRDFESLPLTRDDRSEQGRCERAAVAARLLLKADFERAETD
ncbi:MAG: alpha/beta hydrolase-fold protein [Sphingomonas sp.]|uniref:alpha/beta hydrolase n=1 Tax=Sphingomonas sp. TaxID=28214 RepID=UPI00356370A7